MFVDNLKQYYRFQTSLGNHQLITAITVYVGQGTRGKKRTGFFLPTRSEASPISGRKSTKIINPSGLSYVFGNYLPLAALIDHSGVEGGVDICQYS